MSFSQNLVDLVVVVMCSRRDVFSLYKEVIEECVALDSMQQEICDLQSRIAEFMDIIEKKEAEKARMDKEIEAMSAHCKRLEDQDTFYTEVLLPQLAKEEKEAEIFVREKEEHYRARLEYWQGVWKKYEAVYNTFPGVAERNALREQVKQLEVEKMNKIKLLEEKREELKQQREIKARRLEVARERFLLRYEENRTEKIKLEELKKKNEMTRARIAEKKAKLEELRDKCRKKNEDDLQQQKSQSNASFSKTISVPTLDIPIMDVDMDIFSPSPSLQILAGGNLAQPNILKCSPLPKSMTCGSLSLPSCGPVNAHLKTKQPSFSTDATFSKSKCSVTGISEKSPVPDSHVIQVEIDGDSAIEENEEDRSHPSLELNLVNEVRHTPQDAIYSKEPHSSSFNNKKECVVSTENIAEKMKKNFRPSVSQSEIEHAAIKAREMKTVENIEGTLINLHSVTVLDKPLTLSQSMDCAEKCRSFENSNLIPMEFQSGDKGNSTVHSTHSLNAAHDVAQFGNSAGNLNDPPDDSHTFEFNGEYNDDMYGSLQSPPAFESAMSPIHAGFDSPEVNEENVQETQDEPMESYGAFNFFSQKVHNMFGRPSQNTEKKEKNFTFQF